MLAMNRQFPRRLIPLVGRCLRSRQLMTLGIRREDPGRVWERRVPLTPEAVQSLLSSTRDLKVEVESCRRRCFPDDLYAKVRATSELEQSDVI